MKDELSLKTWFRMLSNTALIEQALRTLFVREFNVTLPQFDLMAALHHAGGTEKMSTLSQWMKVSNGNITGVVDRLERDGLVERKAMPDDRRVKLISLTAEGADVFERMAKRHKEWITQLLGGICEEDLAQLHRQLVQMNGLLKEKLR